MSGTGRGTHKSSNSCPLIQLLDMTLSSMQAFSGDFQEDIYTVRPTQGDSGLNR